MATEEKLRGFQHGDIVGYSVYGRVATRYRDHTSHDETLVLVELTEKKPLLHIEGKSVIDTLTSADRYDHAEEVTHTDLAKQLVGSQGRPFTVVFQKLMGDTRVLRGRLLNHETLFGRSHVVDFDLSHAAGQEAIRMVDHRTIEAIIVNNTLFYLPGGKEHNAKSVQSIIDDYLSKMSTTVAA